MSPCDWRRRRPNSATTSTCILCRTRPGAEAIRRPGDPRRRPVRPHPMPPLAPLGTADRFQPLAADPIGRSPRSTWSTSTSVAPASSGTAAGIAREARSALRVTPHGMLDPWSLRQKSWKKRSAFAAGWRVLDRAAFLHVLNADEGRLMGPLGLTCRSKHPQWRSSTSSCRRSGDDFFQTTYGFLRPAHRVFPRAACT